MIELIIVSTIIYLFYCYNVYYYIFLLVCVICGICLMIQLIIGIIWCYLFFMIKLREFTIELKFNYTPWVLWDKYEDMMVDYYGRDDKLLSNAYKLNFEFKNTINCSICFDPLRDYTSRRESILHCGHRFHTSCLKHWERRITANNTFYEIRWCAICRKKYTRYQRWQYKYCIQN